MPFTWFAHQVPAIGVKLARPAWVDATALCVGSMIPDVMYSFNGYVGFDTHDWGPAMAYGIPLTLVVAVLIRFAAPVVANQLPDLGDVRLRSFAVLSRRRPAWFVTVACAALGIATHIALDSFTHSGRAGTRLLGYANDTVDIAGLHRTVAGVLQWIGHTAGSLAGAALVVHIGRRQLLDQWYGPEAVDEARRWGPSPSQRIVFWTVVAGGGLAGLVWGWSGGYMEEIQRSAVGLFAAAVAVAAVTRTGWRRSGRRSRRRSGADPEMTDFEPAHSWSSSRK
ncbi:MAG: DUF4184 family protein [Ilumatobacteraceae bacterium]